MDAVPAADLIDRGSPIRSWFQLAARKTNIGREILAGLTTFATMSYILVVNSAILSSVGIDTGVLISVTALAAALNTALMALVTNYPLALAPGMGSNAFLAYQVCSAMHIPWPAAFGLVFYNGILFLILAWSGLRQMVLDSFPPTLRVAITCGIGLFIGLVGLKGSHVLIASPQSFIGLGNVTSPECLLFFVGLIFNTLLMWRGVRGALILGIFLVTVLGLFLPSSSGHGMVTSWPTAVVAPPVSIEPTFLKFDLGYLWTHFSLAFPIVLVLFFGDFMSGIGTTLAVCQRAETVGRARPAAAFSPSARHRCVGRLHWRSAGNLNRRPLFGICGRRRGRWTDRVNQLGCSCLFFVSAAFASHHFHYSRGGDGTSTHDGRGLDDAIDHQFELTRSLYRGAGDCYHRYYGSW